MRGAQAPPPKWRNRGPGRADEMIIGGNAPNALFCEARVERGTRARTQKLTGEHGTNRGCSGIRCMFCVARFERTDFLAVPRRGVVVGER